MDQNFAQRLNNIRLFADELPSALIIHRADTLEIVYMNSTGLNILGTTLEELQALGPDLYYVKYFNTEDSNDYVPKIMHIMRSQSNEQVSYFQQVRVPQNTDWQLFVSNTKVFARNEAGETTHLITTAGMIDPVHHITSKVNRVMEEINFLRNNNPLFLTLTKREKEVLKCMAMGNNSGEIAEKLFISSATADTHRRNIRSKLNLKNNYDAVKFAQAYNLV
jgi:DNA-binding NarL/FixJ family response regulator